MVDILNNNKLFLEIGIRIGTGFADDWLLIVIMHVSGGMLLMYPIERHYLLRMFKIYIFGGQYSPERLIYPIDYSSRGLRRDSYVCVWIVV